MYTVSFIGIDRFFRTCVEEATFQSEVAARLFAEAVSAKYGWATLSYEAAEIDPRFNRPKLVTKLFVKGTAQWLSSK